MTKFMKLPNNNNKEEIKKTVFTKFLTHELNIENSTLQPENFNNIIHVGKDRDYGDVFKVWNNGNPRDFVIFFGIKGDEDYIEI